MSSNHDHDHDQIGEVVRAFFEAFTSGPDSAARLDRLRDLLLPEAVVVRTCGGEPTVYDVDGFIVPRAALLSSGTLTEFHEWEIEGRTEIFGDVAHHWCSYGKSWIEHDTRVSGQGVKTIQLVRTAAGWRISAAAWDDERVAPR